MNPHSNRMIFYHNPMNFQLNFPEVALIDPIDFENAQFQDSVRRH